MAENLSELVAEVRNELTDDILPYWIGKVADPESGGFFGRISGRDELFKDAPRGGILNARILWSFAAAYRVIKDPEYLKWATYSKDYILKYFVDHEFGGTYWEINADGTPSNTRKQIYSIAFTIYALVEYYRITQDKEVLDQAVSLFNVIEKYSFDEKQNGYFEAYDRQWNLLEDLRLSPKDANDPKTMNTHLHILEAYTNLYRVYKDEHLKKQLHNLIRIYLDKIVNQETAHLDLFFDENWNCRSSLVSYGHDIEASWLIYEAAEVLGQTDLLEECRVVCLRIAKAACQGILPDGSIINELNYKTGHCDTNRDWWPQAEAVIGFLNAARLGGEKKYQQMAIDNWNFTNHNIIDHKNGEWHWNISKEGIVNLDGDKVGFWKCPYHNSRMCMEVIERLS